MSCVCGRSNNYPNCDGTHKLVGKWREIEDGDAFRILYKSKEDRIKNEPRS